MKGEISYSRKVCTQPYENMTVAYQRQFDITRESADDVFEEVKDFVESKIKTRLAEMVITE